MANRNSGELPSDEFLDSYETRELEQQIFEAGEFVAPSGDLRSRVMEDAKEKTQLQQMGRRLGMLAMGALFAWAISVPLSRSLRSSREELTGPTSSEVERRAIERASSSSSLNKDWAMVEVFMQMRGLETPAMDARE